MKSPAESAELALRFVREGKDLVYDTETSGVDWKRNSVVGYVVGAGGEGKISPNDVVYVPIRHGGGGNLGGGISLKTAEDKTTPHEFEKELAAAFADRERLGLGPVIGHHIKFDCHMSFNHGIRLGRKMICTQNNEALLDEYARSYGLAPSAERHGVTAKKGDELYRHLAAMFGGPDTSASMENFWRLPGTDKLAVEYSIGDGVTTFELYDKQMDKITEEGLQFIYQMESDLIWTVFRMERKGIRVDETYIDELRTATEDHISAILREMPLGFNTRSLKQVREYMEECGHTNWPTTEKGNPSFTEKWLKRTKEGQRIVDIRQASNLLNSFVNPLAERHMFNGRVHANLNQLKNDDRGTVSGRFSCNDPNLQQVPKRIKELAKPFRRLFVADENKIFWERDYSQCEPRLFAHYSQDEALLNGYNSEPFVDAHSVVAELLQVERDPTAKRMNMGIFTGMQPRTFAGHMGWDIPTATEKWHKWFRAFPRVKEFQEKAKHRLKSRGYVYTVLGRRCRLEAPRFAYRGTSKIIQGSNADIVKYKLLECDRICEDNDDIVEILMTVHDSFNGQREDTPEAKKLLDEIVKVMEDVQTDPINLTVPFVMEGFEGPNWSVASFGE